MEDLPTDADPAPATHNREQPVVWERWQKKRTFVRALEGTYSELTKDLLSQPRKPYIVLNATDMTLGHRFEHLAPIAEVIIGHPLGQPQHRGA